MTIARITPLVCLALLAACQPDMPDDSVAPSTVAAPAPAAAPSPVDSRPDDAAVSASADGPADIADGPLDAPADTAMASWSGFGDLQLGSSEAEARVAWGGELKGPAEDSQDCHYLTPVWAKAPADLAFMMEGGKFVRYDIGTDKQAAPGGGKVGMSREQLQSLYAGKLQSSAHKYIPEGQLLAMGEGVAGHAKLVFETDAAGKVNRWRVGLLPQVDYVEGCS